MIERLKRIILTGMFFLFFTSFLSLNAQWLKIYEAMNFDYAYSIQPTNDGGYIVAGCTESFGAGEEDFWVLKLAPSGDIEWQKSYGGSEGERASSIQQTSDGGYIVAGCTESFGAGEEDFWVLKLAPSGDIEWQKTYGGNGWDEAHSIQQTSDGGYIVAGVTNFSWAGGGDFWVLKLSSVGDIEWQKSYGGSEGERASSIQQTIDGGYIVAGCTESFGAGSDDFWILKLSPAGDIEWQKTYGGSKWDKSHSIQQASDGGYIVAGKTESFGAGGIDFWVLKLSSRGDIEWQKSYGGSEWDEAHYIQQTDDGGYIAAGYTGSFGAGKDDTWVLKLATNGDIEWQRICGYSFTDERAHSIQQTSDGGYIVAGDTFKFSASWYDLWIFKLSSNGNIDSACIFLKESNAQISYTDSSSEDTNITPEDTNITPEDTYIFPQDTNAKVYGLCSEKPILSIVTVNSGTTNPKPGIHIYDFGTEVQIKAIPDEEWVFSRWERDVPSGHENDNPIIITMDSDKSIEAWFSLGGDGGEWGEGGGGGEEKGGGCFIATAAYGSPLHPHLDILRDFRDKYLMPNKFGRVLVYFYYKYSPFIAELIAKHKVLKFAVRINLLPLVAFSYSMIHLGPIITPVILVSIFVLPLFLIVFWKKRIIKRL